MERKLIRARPGVEHTRVDPAEMWRYLGFRALSLAKGETLEVETEGLEAAIVPMSGSGVAVAATDSFSLSRIGVFDQGADLLYVPPDTRLKLNATANWCLAIGTAPATGRYPVRLVTSDEMRVEVRGGGPARRQVNHVLVPPLPAERLIVYEVFVPGGAWAGWPPHCHDGLHGSPYLEETYFFRFDRDDGFGFQRNYLADESYDEVFTVRNNDCVAVPRGFHVTSAAPGHNMWILNFLAGDLVGEARATPPYFDPSTTWITDDWTRGQLDLPVEVA